MHYCPMRASCGFGAKRDRGTSCRTLICGKARTSTVESYADRREAKVMTQSTSGFFAMASLEFCIRTTSRIGPMGWGDRALALSLSLSLSSSRYEGLLSLSRSFSLSLFLFGISLFLSLSLLSLSLYCLTLLCISVTLFCLSHCNCLVCQVSRLLNVALVLAHFLFIGRFRSLTLPCPETPCLSLSLISHSPSITLSLASPLSVFLDRSSH